jgi:hypothetical protein
MTSIASLGSGIGARLAAAQVRSAEARLDSAERDEDRAARRREQAADDVRDAQRRAERVDRYA